MWIHDDWLGGERSAPFAKREVNLLLNKSRRRQSALLQDVLDAANRDHDPIRTIVQLVADFVDRFVEQVSFEHDLEVVFIARHERRPRRRLKIAHKKSAAHLPIPEISPALEEGHVLWPHRRLPQ